MVMMSTGNDAVHNIVGGEDVKNTENSKYNGAWELFTIYGSSSVAGAWLSLAPAQLCPKRRVWELGAELSCQNDS